MIDITSLLFNYFDDVFIIGSMLFGYAIFFVYYYNSNHWNNLQWADRILFSFLIGSLSFFLIISFFVVPWGIYNKLFKNHILQKNDLYSIWLFVWTSLFVGFYYRFKDYKVPFYTTTKKHWQNFKNKKDTSLYLLALIFITYNLTQRINYINRDLYINDTTSLFLWIFMSYFMLSFFIPLFFYNLTFVPDVEFSFRFKNLILNLDYFSNTKCNEKIVKFFIILLIFCYSVTSLDSTYGIYTPKIFLIEEKLFDDIDIQIINHIDKYSVPIVRRELTYYINQPLLFQIGVFPITNIRLENPSNLTINDERMKTSIEQGNFYKPMVEDAVISVLLDEKWVEKIQFKVIFYQELDSSTLYLIDHKEYRYVEADHEFINYTIQINNIGNNDIRFNNFKLKELNYYEDVINYTTNNENIYVDVYKSYNDLILYCNVRRNQSIIINIVLVKGDY